MTTIALSKAPGSSRPLRRDDAMEALGDAGQWALDTLREWRRRSRARLQLTGLASACCATSRATRADAIYPSKTLFWKE
jgi:hypothetical protein